MWVGERESDKERERERELLLVVCIYIYIYVNMSVCVSDLFHFNVGIFLSSTNAVNFKSNGST